MVLVLRASSRSDAKCGYVMICLVDCFKKNLPASGDYTHSSTSSLGRFSLALEVGREFSRPTSKLKPGKSALGTRLLTSLTLYALGFKGT